MPDRTKVAPKIEPAEKVHANDEELYAFNGRVSTEHPDGDVGTFAGLCIPAFTKQWGEEYCCAVRVCLVYSSFDLHLYIN